MIECVKKYCALLCPSGYEDAVREQIISDIKDSGCQYKTDKLGNLVVFKKGKKSRDKKVLFSAHMDEVGFMARYITDDGYIYFGCVGGIDRSVVSGRRLIFPKTGVIGVIASKSIHIQKPEEFGKCESTDDMYIDIGCYSRESAEEYVSIGDYAVFLPNYEEFGEDLVVSKALDDRFGCAVLVDMINSNLEYDTYFAFNTCEEIGCDGAKEVAYNENPDIVFALEATTAGDIAGVPEERYACRLGYGAVISHMDRGTIYDKELVDAIFEIAKENDIKCQQKNIIAGGNEASAYQLTANGARVAAISLPTRYIHSACSVANIEDIKSVCNLVHAVNKRSF